MANRQNFQSDIDLLSEEYRRFSVSRIFDTTQDDLLEVEYPVGATTENVFVQLSFYSIADDSLIYVTTLKRPSDAPDAFFMRTLQYEDGSVRTMFFVNFALLELEDELPVGQFVVVINFFVSEFGDYTNNPFRITQISPSRTEVQLTLLSGERTPEMFEKLKLFSYPQVNGTWVTESINVMYNKSDGNGIPTETVSLSVENLLEEFPTGILEVAKTEILDVMNGLLTASYGQVTASIHTQLDAGKTRFTNEELYSLVSQSLSEQYVLLLDAIALTQRDLKFSLPEQEDGGIE